MNTTPTDAQSAIGDSPKRLTIDLLELEGEHKALILQACNPESYVQLSQLDKGLSGSTVWIARWPINKGVWTKPHVFKIGPLHKLQNERKAVETIASTLMRNFPQMELYEDASNNIGLLRHEFAGEISPKPMNFKETIQKMTTPQEVSELIKRLYLDRMKEWHTAVSDSTNNHASYSDSAITQTYDQALDWWVSRINLENSTSQLDKPELEQSLKRYADIDIERLKHYVAHILSITDTFALGPVHGDLHCQNILIDHMSNMHLIDFGWTAIRWRAIDFLMLECSLKFIVSPPDAELVDLLQLDEKIDEEGPIESLLSDIRCIYGNEMRKIAAGVFEIRRIALQLGAVSDMMQYRKGLFLLQVALSSYPNFVNRPYIFHSCAHLLRKMKLI